MDTTKHLKDRHPESSTHFSLLKILDETRSVLGGILIGLVVVKFLPVQSEFADLYGGLAGAVGVMIAIRLFHLR